MNKVKRSRFEKFVTVFFSFSFVLFVVFSIALNGMNYSLTTKTQKIEKEITVLNSEIESLDMEKQKLVSFSRLSEIAGIYGFEYHQESVASVGSVGFAE